MPKQVLNYHDVQLYDTDVALFRDNEWLNDNAINFYFQYLQETLDVSSAPDARTRSDVLLVDPAVVSCILLQCDEEDEYADLGRGMQLGIRQVCMIPVNDNQSFDEGSTHWSLLLYHRQEKSFLHYDSSSGHNAAAADRVCKAFLRVLQATGVTDAPAWSPDIVQQMPDMPQQRNSYDCGMYVLLAAEFLYRRYFRLPTSDWMRQFVTPQRVAAMRQEIPKIIDTLIHEHKMLAALEQRDEHIDILMLSEMVFTGYVFQRKEDVEGVAEIASKGPTFAWCQAKARRFRCLVTCGYVERDEATALLYNSMMVVSPEGELVCNPRKTFLYETDKLWATPGDGFKTWHCPWLDKTIAFGICMDINPDDFEAPFDRFEFATNAAEQRADLVLFACAWCDFEPESDDTMPTVNYWATRLTPIIDALQKDAYGKPSCHFLVSNRIGTENGTFFVGASCVISLKEPELLALAGRREETLLLVNVP
ncbi:hypothetical protein P43SY_005606 [Pythium insidiosum]|uniref:Ubiquitin-like protease family profile domain-containing protein n=1 Tax=Pythium insidiosum TaxID=114742 RepID=A0AAD5LE51_PYTIN|nr:hypothetical protein P43SY_005606 [Pythium insidiosum]